MKKSNIVELREMLLNKEMSFMYLDNLMYNSGYYTVYDSGVISNIKEDLNVVYTAMDTSIPEIQLFFVITKDNKDDISEGSFYVKVVDIQEF